MTQHRPSVANGLSRLVDALEVALAAHMDADVEAERSLRRLAGALSDAAPEEGLGDLPGLAQQVLRAQPNELAFCTRRLVQGVRRFIGETPLSTILVVDDDAFLCRLLQVKLAGPDRKVEVATSLRRAEELLTGGGVDAMVLDLFLPDGDGRALLADVRAHPATAALPVFVLSGHDGPVVRAESLALGADSFFTKPFDGDALAAMVGMALSRARRDADTPNRREDPRRRAMAHFRRIREEGTGATVAAVLPTWYGVGIDHSPDDDAFGALLSALGDELPASAVAARWSARDVIVVGRASEVALRSTLDRVRFRLRAAAHRTHSGAMLTMSAGVVTAAPAEDLVRAHLRASDLATGALSAGGDRVVTARRPTRSARVLLAVEDPEIAQILLRHLTEDGFEVTHHGKGPEALRAAEEGGFALAIVAVGTVGPDGLDVLAQLRNGTGTQRLPVMVLTGLDGEDHVNRGLDLGADDYILMPFSIEELTARVRRLAARP